jgi:CO dehydrogenase nickel-insertion accessory protein CooC1
MPKLAITGKGGVGKTTLASVLALLYAAEGRTVLAIDADPDANLGAALGNTYRTTGGVDTRTNGKQARHDRRFLQD